MRLRPSASSRPRSGGLRGALAQTARVRFDAPAARHGPGIAGKSSPTARQAAGAEAIHGLRADGPPRRIFGKCFPAELARALAES